MENRGGYHQPGGASAIKSDALAVPTEYFVYNANGTGNYINEDGEATHNFTFTVAKAVIKMNATGVEGSDGGMSLA